mmetsp:Transcript_88226/g.263051  ORF Transcript_88226/g.263051 Transcript_88226/m.263051 type:complete len:203 (-) Transcript_88226:85-693(-)
MAEVASPLALAPQLPNPALDEDSPHRGTAEDAAGPERPAEVAVAYGGNYPWVGAAYKLQVRGGASPLQWLNGLASRLFILGDMVLEADGGFRRPGEAAPLFPKGGINLRWRWDAARRCIIIDFYADGELMHWRWDELTPSRELRFPSTVPDWEGIGHVRKMTFKYSLLSAVAEAAVHDTHDHRKRDTASHRESGTGECQQQP